MKKCPQCNSVFEDDNEFCLNDGSILIVAELTQTHYASNDIPTVVTPSFQAPIATSNVENRVKMKWVYPVVGLLIGIIVILGYIAFSLSQNKETNHKEITSSEKAKSAKESDKKNNSELPPQQKQTHEKVLASAEPPVEKSNKSDGRFPESSNRYLTQIDLNGKSNWELRIMRNEIFARHGYIFKTRELRNYFVSQDWYQPKSRNVSAYLNGFEKWNVKFLKRHE